MTDEPGLIEVGEVQADGLDYWRAKEAMRQGEARLAFQATALMALEARATSLVGWSVAGATAMVSALLIASLPQATAWAAAAALVSLTLAAMAGASVLRPGDWTPFGNPQALLNSTHKNELTDLQAMAGGLELARSSNADRLKRRGRALALGLLLLAATPAVAAAGWLIARAIPSPAAVAAGPAAAAAGDQRSQ